ncbi:MAG: hypothetical protein IH592_01845 [Bacteroidales bacterium]|nr:hypothetical protein [Bacteroidales bacterium]
MFKLLRRPSIFKLITWSMLGPFLIMTGGCNYFRVHSSDKPYPAVIQQMQEEQKFIILHLGDKAWHLTDIKTDEKNITGSLSFLSGHEMYKTAVPDKANRYKKAMRYDQSDLLNEVHIYASELVITDQVKVSVPADAILRVEVYSKARGATAFSYLSVPLGILAGAFVVTGIIVALTSCPFVYVFDGADYVFIGEMFSGAIQPGLERDDYLPLPGISPADGTYRIKVTNELKERQYVNMAELMLVDHGKDVSVLTDKNGFPFTVLSPQIPVSAATGINTDVLQLISERDTRSFTGIEGIADEKSINNIVLKFVKPAEASAGSLLIRAKNTMWMEAVSSGIHELFGERYDSFSARREEVPGKKLQKWQLEQQLPLSVYIEKNNRWEFIDYFNIAGPAAMRDDILRLNLEDINSDTVKIRLETGFRFWEIDYTAMDFSNQEKVAVSMVPLTTATANGDIEVKETLAATDNIYYVLDEQGDEAALVFNCPELKDDCRSVFLHSRGYYKVLRDQTGPPDKKTLRSFRKPGSIPLFSREMHDSMK